MPSSSAGVRIVRLTAPARMPIALARSSSAESWMLSL
jgi:hypothetical protein